MFHLCIEEVQKYSELNSTIDALRTSNSVIGLSEIGLFLAKKISMNELKEGHIYHTITYGLNAMGPHASQISSEERWKIVHYIKEELQKEE